MGDEVISSEPPPEVPPAVVEEPFGVAEIRSSFVTLVDPLGRPDGDPPPGFAAGVVVVVAAVVVVVVAAIVVDVVDVDSDVTAVHWAYNVKSSV